MKRCSTSLVNSEMQINPQELEELKLQWLTFLYVDHSAEKQGLSMIPEGIKNYFGVSYKFRDMPTI